MHSTGLSWRRIACIFVQAGCGWSIAAGTGLVVARKGEHGDWSPPSALGLYSLGWGLQIGGSLCDLLIVLRNQ